MKNVILLILLSVAFSACNSQNSGVHFGKKPLQLAGFNFNLDIPDFFNDERVFRSGSDISMGAEEEEVDMEEESKPFKYVRYGQTSSNSETKVAAYKDFKFREMMLCTDSADKKTFLVGAEQSDLKPADIDKLVALLKKDFGDPVSISQIEKPNEDVSYEWHKADKIVKLVLNIEQDQLKDELQGDWQKKAYQSSNDITANLFIATPEFDKVMTAASSFTGMLVKYR